MFPWLRKLFGTRSERAAARYLQRAGVRILARNVTLPEGELDLVGRQGDCFVFVEVRSTSAATDDAVAASVDRAKQRKLTQLAVRYVQRNRLAGVACRFDVVTVCWPTGQAQPYITHYAHAFESTQ